MADFAGAETESELSDAKKTVEDLIQRIEESNSRVEIQVRDMEKMRRVGTTGRRKEGETNLSVNRIQELESMKRELSKLKLDMVVAVEEKRRAESILASLSSVETLSKEIEETNEEHVLVELARIEAVKEYQDIEAQRREETARYSTAIAETRKKKYQMILEINAAKGLEEKLAITLSDINMLQSELTQIREMKSSEGTAGSLLEALRKELGDMRKELGSIEAEAFQYMVSMDAARNELKIVAEETTMVKKEEERTEMNIQNLNSKLLRANMKLEAKRVTEAKSRSLLSNLLLNLEQLKSETAAAQIERSKVIEENAGVRKEIQTTETDIQLAEEQLQCAVQDLIAAKSSEAIALENLRTYSEKTVISRAAISRTSSKITISKFEYEYLKDRAAGAMEIAKKKLAAAEAWTDTVKESEKLIQKTLFMGRETRKGPETEESTKRVYEMDDESEKSESNEQVQTAYSSKGMNRRSIKITQPRRGKVRRSVSQVVRTSRRSTSVGRRTKVMTNLSNLFSGQ